MIVMVTYLPSLVFGDNIVTIHYFSSMNTDSNSDNSWWWELLNDHIAMENGPYVADLPIKDGDFP